MFLKATILIVALQLYNSSAFPGGANLASCASFAPPHGQNNPQNIGAPFSITTSSNHINQAQRIAVNIETTSDTFRGFMIQARNNDGTSQVIGRFISGPNVNLLDCPNTPTQSTATHTSRTEKISLKIEWEATPDFTGVVIFHATVVQDITAFWTEIVSEPVFISIENDLTPPEVDNFDPFLGCGSTKTCFGVPDNCYNTGNCELFGAVTPRPGTFTFELLSKSGAAYIAMALSDDRHMGSDSVIECTNENGIINAYTSWTEGTSGSPRTNIEQNIISLRKWRFDDGMIYCEVDRIPLSTVRGVQFDLINAKHFLLIASGHGLFENSVGIHDIGRQSSNRAYLLTEVGVVTADVRILLMVHGSFMIVSWIGAASIGIFMPRYFKQTWTNSKSFGKDVWFLWHISCMLTTWILTISAFVIIFIEIGEWRTSAHSILGTITTVLCFLMPIGAVLRPGPNATNRPLFNFLHQSFGNICYVLAILTIFYAVPKPGLQIPDWTTFVLVAFIVFYLVMHLIFSTIRTCGEIKMKSRMGISKDAAFPLLRKTLMGFYAIVVVLFAIFLVFIIT